MKKTPAVELAVLTLLTVALPALAAPARLSSQIETAVTRSVSQYQSLESPFETFTRQIQEIKKPAAEPLLTVLQPLTAYNQVFETEKDLNTLRSLAAKLEGPIAVPWNTYRGNGLKEIFDTYIPNSHGNKDLAQLEYYVKFYTLPTKTHNQTYLVSKTLPEYFVQSYHQLTAQLATTSKRNDKELLKQIVAFIPAYNSLIVQDPIVANELLSSLFDMPVQTGWDRTFSLKDLAFQLGLDDEYSEGRDVRTAEQLQRKLGATQAEAELFEPFVRALRQAR